MLKEFNVSKPQSNNSQILRNTKRIAFADMYQATKEYYDLFYNCDLTPSMYYELMKNSLLK